MMVLNQPTILKLLLVLINSLKWLVAMNEKIKSLLWVLGFDKTSWKKETIKKKKKHFQDWRS